MGFTEKIIEWSTHLIDTLGYTGIFVLMVFESMIAPIPSEAVMPFAGFLIHDGRMTWVGVFIASLVGSFLGSVLSYAVGKYLGIPFVKRFGKYLLLNEHHLEMTHSYFEKYGDRTVLIARWIPVVRHLISIPAGVASMPFGKFVVFTLLGAGTWNMFLTYVGYMLRGQWMIIKNYTHYLDYIAVIAILVAVAWFVQSRLKALKAKKG